MAISLGDCEAVLKAAFSADESGDSQRALQLYTDFVEMTLKMQDAPNKLKLLASQALDRAEDIKGASKATKSSPVQQSRPRTNDASSSLSNVGPSSYSEDELKVLEHGSKINSLVIVPFMSVDLQEKFHYPIPFTDGDGTLQLSPKQRKDLQGWVRISELAEDPKMIANATVDFVSIRQTVVSDCSFVSSLTVAALYETKFQKPLISAILYPKNSHGRPVYNPSGKYFVKLHVNGVSRKVVVDDYLPVGKYNQLLCSHSKHRNEFWVSILEKAYLKVMGGYDFPGSNSNIDLNALTGWIPERIQIGRKEAQEANAVFERLSNGLSLGRCLVTIATGELSAVEEQRTGLVPTHAYAVLDMKIVNGVRLVQMKNPWSHLRWKGNYSEEDQYHWTEELKEQLNYDPKKAAQFDNGIFWIDFHSVVNFFDVFYINWDPALFKNTYCVHQMWNAGVGPPKDAYTISENPQFLLKIGPGSGSVWVLLTRHITSIEDFRDNREYITIVAYENKGRKVYYPYEPRPFHEGTRINSPHYLCKIRQDPNESRQITLAISQYEKTKTIYFTLRSYSRAPFELQKIESRFISRAEVSGKWTEATAGGCANYPQTYKNNPKIKLTVGAKPQSRPCVEIELRGPKSYQVGFEVAMLDGSDSFGTFGTFEKMSSGNYRSGYCALEILHMPPGQYLITPTTFVPGQTGPFIVNARAQNAIKLEEFRQ